MAQKQKQIGLIGAGAWGKNHLRNLYNLGVLNTVLETSDAISKQRKVDFPDTNYVKELDVFLNISEIKGIVIAAPAELHYQLTKKCLLAGKDVLVEKPLALNVEQGEELVKIAAENKRVLMVGHILQYHSAVIKLKEMIDKGELGKIRYIYSNRLNIGKLRTEENVLWSFAPHDISLIVMFMDGEEPSRVEAHGGSYINSNIYDTTMTTVEFNNGVKGHVFVSWLHPFKEQKLVVVGSEKMVVFDDLSKEKLFIYPHKITWEKGKIPVAHKEEFITLDIELKQPLEEELKHFVHCVETRETPKTDGKEGLTVLKVLEQAQKKLH
ncbi:MAG: Gfo/Idh/MocA family oxidoreductase [Bacteroidales bacterium]|nr:Gfo/Idh/MocA family oxidoreductase [Bacteroidales bacterium]MCF8405393.1 Gfo/Idh/MocA family oxidoreductase [Bacteroidales bacterium]